MLSKSTPAAMPNLLEAQAKVTKAFLPQILHTPLGKIPKRTHTVNVTLPRERISEQWVTQVCTWVYELIDYQREKRLKPHSSLCLQ